MLLKLENIVKSFVRNERKLIAVDKFNISIDEGEFVSIYGYSGCGKSTVLNIICGMCRADRGSVLFNNENISAMSQKRLAEYRRDDVSYVMQGDNLLNNFTVRQNIALLHKNDEKFKERIEYYADAIGIGECLEAYPSQLSGGQAKRAGIARALASDSKLIIADEPTANLDSQSADRIIEILRQECKKRRTVLISTHDSKVLEVSDKNYSMEKEG